MIKDILKTHKVFFMVIFIIVIAAYLWNIFIDKNTIVLAGEYIFSFDYVGHVKNILTDPRSIEANDYTNCFDCIDFYHYSRWYSLFKIGYHAISQIIGLHPFIYLILSMTITQLTSLYFFSKVILKKFSWLAFGISSFVFIFYPYKYSLLVETHDGLLYSNMLLYLTALLWFFKSLKTITFKKVFIFALVNGFLFSFFLNINIAFFPIVLYMTLLVGLFYIKTIVGNIIKLISYVFIFIIPSIAINLPFLQSLLRLGDSRHYEGYISFNIIDSWLAGLWTAQTNPNIIIAFIVLLVLCVLFAKLEFKNKLFLLLLYSFVAIMVLGMNSSVNIYGWMFENLPLIDSLRATYRYMFFELLIMYIFIYFLILRYKENFFYTIIVFIVGGMSMLLPLVHIYLQRDYFFVSHLPQEYFDTQKYINSIDGQKMYFPPTTVLFHNIATDYVWGDKNYTKSILLYKNPYTSLLPIKNLVQFERFPYLLSPQFLELRYLTDLRNSQSDILQAMELRGVKYVIVDKNYRWSENYPSFDVNRFIQKAKIVKEFNNLIVLQLPDKSNLCKPGYGDIRLDYCTSLSSDAKLLNKSNEEFILETKPQLIGNTLLLRKNSVYTKSILDPQIYDIFIKNRILFNKNIMQLFGNQNAVFTSTSLQEGKYKIFVSSFQHTVNNHLMGNSKLVFKLDGKSFEEVSSNGTIDTLMWKSFEFTAKDNQQITVDITGKGYMILGSAPIIEKL